jgi:hypothetical protein
MIAKYVTGFNENSSVVLDNLLNGRWSGDIFCSYGVWYVAKYEYDIQNETFTKLSTGLDYSQIMPQNYKYFVYDRPSYSLVSNEFVANLRGNIPGISSYVVYDTIGTGGTYLFRQSIDESMYACIGSDLTLANDLQVNAGTKPSHNQNSQRTYWRLN